MIPDSVKMDLTGEQLKKRFGFEIYTPDEAEVSTEKLIFRGLGYLVCTTLTEPPQE